MDALIRDLAADRRGLGLCRIAGWPVSRRELAAMTGLCEATIRAWETRRATSRPDTIKKIRRAIIRIARGR